MEGGGRRERTVAMTVCERLAKRSLRSTPTLTLCQSLHVARHTLQVCQRCARHCHEAVAHAEVQLRSDVQGITPASQGDREAAPGECGARLVVSKGRKIRS